MRGSGDKWRIVCRHGRRRAGVAESGLLRSWSALVAFDVRQRDLCRPSRARVHAFCIVRRDCLPRHREASERAPGSIGSIGSGDVAVSEFKT